MQKNDAQLSGFAVVKKAPSQWKKRFLKKKFPAFFVNIRNLRYLTYGDFTVPKNCSSQQNYYERQKTTSFWRKIISQIISQNLFKIGLNPKELELFDEALIMN